ncbi:MAG: Ig-like domain-containing protein [Lachnospiraceae bacterium]|nr:Ig-like domain-containing protein [Lachnospiraceae bacterium]
MKKRKVMALLLTACMCLQPGTTWLAEESAEDYAEELVLAGEDAEGEEAYAEDELYVSEEALSTEAEWDEVDDEGDLFEEEEMEEAVEGLSSNISVKRPDWNILFEKGGVIISPGIVETTAANKNLRYTWYYYEFSDYNSYGTSKDCLQDGGRATLLATRYGRYRCKISDIYGYNKSVDVFVVPFLCKGNIQQTRDGSMIKLSAPKMDVVPGESISYQWKVRDEENEDIEISTEPSITVPADGKHYSLYLRCGTYWEGLSTTVDGISIDDDSDYISDLFFDENGQVSLRFPEVNNPLEKELDYRWYVEGEAEEENEIPELRGKSAVVVSMDPTSSYNYRNFCAECISGEAVRQVVFNVKVFDCEWPDNYVRIKNGTATLNAPKIKGVDPSRAEYLWYRWDEEEGDDCYVGQGAALTVQKAGSYDCIVKVGNAEDLYGYVVYEEYDPLASVADAKRMELDKPIVVDNIRNQEQDVQFSVASCGVYRLRVDYNNNAELDPNFYPYLMAYDVGNDELSSWHDWDMTITKNDYSLQMNKDVVYYLRLGKTENWLDWHDEEDADMLSQLPTQATVSLTKIENHHAVEVAIPDTPATATAHGTTGGTKCAWCNEVIQAPVQNGDHVLKCVPGKAATCLAAGYKTYWVCSIDSCKKMFSDAAGKNQITKPVAIAKLPATISLTNTTIPLQVGKTVNLAPFVGGLAKGDSIVKWSSDRIAVATVDKSGKVKAAKKINKKKEVVKIKVTLKSGKTGTFTINVQKGAVATKSITGVPSKLTMKKGTQKKLTPVIAPVTSLNKVKFKSSAPKIASVSSKGLIKAKKVGKAVITITSGKKTKKVTVRVVK